MGLDHFSNGPLLDGMVARGYAMYAIIPMYIFTIQSTVLFVIIHRKISIITLIYAKCFNYQDFHVEVFAEATNPTRRTFNEGRGRGQVIVPNRKGTPYKGKGRGRWSGRCMARP